MARLVGLAARVEQRARDRAARLLNAAETAAADIPGIHAQREGDWLIMSGRNLVRRWVNEIPLRFALWRAR